MQEELGLTYLCISHDLVVGEYLSDRVLVMYLGRIVEEAHAYDLYRSPRHPYTRTLLSAIPRLDPGRKVAGERIVLPGESESGAGSGKGCPCEPHCPDPRKDGECKRRVQSLGLKARGHRVACGKVPERFSGKS